MFYLTKHITEVLIVSLKKNYMALFKIINDLLWCEKFVF